MDDPHDGIATHEARGRRVLVGRAGGGREKDLKANELWLGDLEVGTGAPSVKKCSIDQDRWKFWEVWLECGQRN